MQVIGHDKKPDWPKLGPSLMIATALVVAIRTAKWVAKMTGGEHYVRRRYRARQGSDPCHTDHYASVPHADAQESFDVPAGGCADHGAERRRVAPVTPLTSKASLSRARPYSRVRGCLESASVYLDSRC